MIKLEILNADGSIYWTEHFNSVQHQEEWLVEEQTRPYYKAEFTTVVTDLTPVVDVALEARNSLLKAIADAEASITPRRVRECLISGDKSFIEGVEAQIVALRNQLI
jgi:hypothetical protein